MDLENLEVCKCKDINEKIAKMWWRLAFEYHGDICNECNGVICV